MSLICADKVLWNIFLFSRSLPEILKSWFFQISCFILADFTFYVYSIERIRIKFLKTVRCVCCHNFFWFFKKYSFIAWQIPAWKQSKPNCFSLVTVVLNKVARCDSSNTRYVIYSCMKSRYMFEIKNNKLRFNNRAKSAIYVAWWDNKR